MTNISISDNKPGAEVGNNRTDHHLPYDLNVEMALLGSLLIEPNSIGPVVKIVDGPNALFLPRHQAIFAAILELFHADTGIDGLTLLNRLQQKNILEVAGGREYIRELLDCVPSAANAMYYAKIIHQLAIRRRKISAHAAALAGLQNGATDELVDAAFTAATVDLIQASEVPDPTAPREPFPLDALPEVVANYVHEVATALPCAPETSALPLLAAVGAAIGNSRRIGLKSSWCEPPVIWTCTILPSGKLKSPAHEKAVRFLTQRQRKLIKAYERARWDYDNECEKWEIEKSQCKKAGGELPPPPEPPKCERLTTSDTTVEALADLLSDNERGIFLERDELSGFFGSFDRYSNGSGSDLAAYLSMHRAGQLVVDRKTGKRVTYVDRAAVCIAGTIQPGTLKRCLTPAYFESGLPARILLAMPESPLRRWSEAAVSSAVERGVELLFDCLLALKMDSLIDDVGEEYREPVILPLSPEAKPVWIQFYNQHAEEQEELSDEHESAAFSKLEAYAARLALIFTLCRNPNAMDIDIKSMTDALRLTRWFCAETRRVYQMLSETPDDASARGLAQIIRCKFKGVITPHDLWRTSGGYRPTSKAEAALENLIRRGYGRWEVLPSTGGRNKTVFVLNGFDAPVVVKEVVEIEENETSLTNNNPPATNLSNVPNPDEVPVALQMAASEEAAALAAERGGADL